MAIESPKDKAKRLLTIPIMSLDSSIVVDVRMDWYDIQSQAPHLVDELKEKKLLSEEYVDKPTLQDILLLISMGEYIFNMPEDYKTFPLDDGEDVKGIVPTVSQFQKATIEFMKKIAKKPEELDFNADIDAENDKLRDTMKTVSTLPNTIVFIEDVLQGKPVRAAMARGVKGTIDTYIDEMLEMNMDLEPFDIDETTNYAETKNLAYALTQFARATPTLVGGDLQTTIAHLKPKYMQDASFRAIVTELERIQSTPAAIAAEDQLTKTLRALAQISELEKIIAPYVEQEFTPNAKEMEDAHKIGVEVDKTVTSTTNHAKIAREKLLEIYGVLGVDIRTRRQGG